MKLHFVNSGLFKLDGGAMFGIIPKKMWNKLNPADEDNLCTWIMRCLLIEDGNRLILVDTGMGDKQDEKFRSFFQPFGDDNLLSSLDKLGFRPGDITDVFLTHLHFDHVGGAVMRNDSGNLVPTFPNAIYWSSKIHWEWAMNPNSREAASFLKENFVPLQEAGVVKYIEYSGQEIFPGVTTQFLFGHTEEMMGLHIDTGTSKFFYCADLVPSSFHIGLPYIMAYDLRPLVTLKEKEQLLERAVTENIYLLFEHDPTTGCVSVKKNEQGRIVIDQHVALASFI
ncbi:MAG TPA: MBL fold metallo-hydrolase [Saprospiraceae bacterium]|nr:MBL fold metallo-hydrolase [Saprospiraceae bacterium]